MSEKVTRNDIPGVPAVKHALLETLVSGRSRSFESIAGDVAKALGLSRAQRAYRIGKSSGTLFENRLVQARAELTKEGAVTYKSGKVKLVKRDTPAKADQHAKSDAGAARSGKPASVAPEGRPTKCLSFQEPFASYIVTGVKDAEFRSKKVNAPIRDLVVCASKTPKKYPYKLAGLAYGLAIGMVDVVDCVGVEGDHMWKLENPRLIKPFEVHATAGFFYVADIPEVIPNTEEAYREHVLPHCFRSDRESEDSNIASLFSHVPDKGQIATGVASEKFDRMKKRHPYNVKR